jgi:transcriptional regulator with XRE-family HTH domain
MQLGQVMKERRLELGLSLRELAQMSGLTASFLSQVERDLTSPSIESLRKISEALDVPMFRFLVEQEPRSPVVRRNQRVKLSFGDRGADYQLLTPDLNRSRSMEVFLEEWEPGRERTTMPLRRYTEEFIYVLQGRLEIQLGEEVHTLDAGDSIYFEGPLLHRLAAKGPEILRMLSVITPPIF